MRFNGFRAVLATLLSVSLICSPSNTIAIAEVLASEGAASGTTEATGAEPESQPQTMTLDGEAVVSETATQPTVAMPDGVEVTTDVTAVDGTPVSDDIVEAVEEAGSDVNQIYDSEGNLATDRNGDGVITLDDIDLPNSDRYDPEVLIDESAEQNQAVATGQSTTRSAIMRTQVGLSLATTAAQRPWTKTSEGIVGLDGVTIVPGAVHKGIDVASYQGDIDWAKVKADGVDFVILRIGVVIYGVEYEDTKFAYNVSECQRLGIPYGVYLYSYATITSTAQKEANLVVRLLRKYNLHPQLPVYYDMEQKKSKDDPTPDAEIGMLPTLATTYCDIIANAGYTPGVYASLSWWRDYLTDPCFEKWDRWVAQYYSSCTYEGSYHYWQCSDAGYVDGITMVKDGQTVLRPCDVDLDMQGGSWSQEVTTEKNVYTGSEVTGRWTRLYGHDAYSTMAAVLGADMVFPDNSGGTVVLATGDGYWDALSAAALAGCYGAPIVTTTSSALSSVAEQELRRINPRNVIIMGGPLAISTATEDAVRAACPNATVTRVYGNKADDTAVAAYEAGYSWGSTCAVATVNGYWDALSIAPYAYAKRAPIFLTNATTGMLSDATLQAIGDGGFSRVVIAGGTDAVSASVEAQLQSLGVEVIRKGGTDAIDTSRVIAQWELSQGMRIEHMAVATSGGYWDALAAAALVGKQNSILVLTDSNVSQRGAITGVYTLGLGGVTSGYVLGGTLAISDSIWGYL